MPFSLLQTGSKVGDVRASLHPGLHRHPMAVCPHLSSSAAPMALSTDFLPARRDRRSGFGGLRQKVSVVGEIDAAIVVVVAAAAVADAEAACSWMTAFLSKQRGSGCRWRAASSAGSCSMHDQQRARDLARVLVMLHRGMSRQGGFGEARGPGQSPDRNLVFRCTLDVSMLASSVYVRDIQDDAWVRTIAGSHAFHRSKACAHRI
jgi:hypothetical protein